VVGCWHDYLSGATYKCAYGPADATAIHYLLLQKIHIVLTFLVLTFWYRLTQVVPNKIHRAVKGRMPFLPPNQQHKSTEETEKYIYKRVLLINELA